MHERDHEQFSLFTITGEFYYNYTIQENIFSSKYLQIKSRQWHS